MPRFSVGVDVGGTFTDCVIREGAGGAVFDKAFSTPGGLGEGVLRAVENAGAQLGLSLDQVLADTDVFKIGTTSAVNRLINRAGARTALLTTRGHEDAIFIGRVQQKTDGLPDEERADIARWRKAEPMVSHSAVVGIEERMDCFGEVVCPLDERQVESAARTLAEDGVKAFAICFLWSFLNPRHELAAKAIVEKVASSAFVTASSELAAVLGEYERASTTVVNSYLGPGTTIDLSQMEAVLRERGLRSEVFLMQSNGGVTSTAQAVRSPVHLLASGPVGGVKASQTLSIGGGNLITTDMGGTSFDVGVIVKGAPIEKTMSVHNRYRVLAPAIEVSSIGAGGGSIARVDRITGILQVGPRSAGSSPGPVCYGFGGMEPTVTDANAVLGRLNPRRFFAGRHELDVAGARRAIEERIARVLGTDVESAAAAILRIVDSRMADLIRNLTIERGHDPREFTLVAYGGGGPLHAGSYAADLGIASVVIPRSASTYSAWGIAHSPIVQQYAISAPALLPLGGERIRERFARVAERIPAEVAAGMDRSLFVDMRYRYQLQELRVPLSEDELVREHLDDVLMERFEEMYVKRFGRGSGLRSAGIEASTFRIVATREFAFGALPQGSCASAAPANQHRSVWFGSGFQEVPVYDAEAAGAAFHVEGPCLVEGDLLTAVVHPAQSVRLDETGDFILDLAGL